MRKKPSLTSTPAAAFAFLEGPLLTHSGHLPALSLEYNSCERSKFPTWKVE
jgi:hypothetical protein